MNSISLTLFIALPAPIKMALIVIFGFSYVGIRAQHQAKARAIEAAPELVAPEFQEVPAQPVFVPPVPVKPAPGAKPLEILVNSDGSYQVAGKQLTGPELVKELKPIAELTPQRRIVLQADARTPYQMVTNAVKLTKAAGLTNVSFASKPDAP